MLYGKSVKIFFCLLNAKKKGQRIMCPDNLLPTDKYMIMKHNCSSLLIEDAVNFELQEDDSEWHFFQREDGYFERGQLIFE